MCLRERARLAQRSAVAILDWACCAIASDTPGWLPKSHARRGTSKEIRFVDLCIYRSPKYNDV